MPSRVQRAFRVVAKHPNATTGEKKNIQVTPLKTKQETLPGPREGV